MLRKLWLVAALIAPLSTVLLPTAAIASTWSSGGSEATAFNVNVEDICDLNPNTPVPYRTVYNGVEFNGRLYVDTTRGCGNNYLRLSGTFMEEGVNEHQLCHGNMVLRLNFNTQAGSVRWSNIHAEGEHACTGSGTAPTLDLYMQ